MGKERLLPIFALLILLTACASSLYVYATHSTAETILINGQNYTTDELFSLVTPRSLNDSEYSGIALDDLMVKTGISSPEQHTYTLKGADGYEKTVTWDNLKNGLLTHDRTTVFSDLPKAFQVKDIITIEVN